MLVVFHRYVNNRITNCSCIGAVIDKWVILTDNLDKANGFNPYFSTVGISGDAVVPQSVSTLNSVTINEADVLSSIDRLKCKK